MCIHHLPCPAEDLVEDHDEHVYQCSADGIFLSLEKDGLDWSAAICGPESAVEFVGKTRGVARTECQGKWGKPDLVVDKKQSCSCCPIRCAAPPEAPVGDVELKGKLADEARAVCDDHPSWGNGKAKLRLREKRLPILLKRSARSHTQRTALPQTFAIWVQTFTC